MCHFFLLEYILYYNKNRLLALHSLKFVAYSLLRKQKSFFFKLYLLVSLTLLCFKFYKCTSCIVTKDNFKGTRFHFHTRLQKIGKPNCERDNQNPYIEKEQTTQWPKEKVQKAKQRSTKHTHKN